MMTPRPRPKRATDHEAELRFKNMALQTGTDVVFAPVTFDGEHFAVRWKSRFAPKKVYGTLLVPYAELLDHHLQWYAPGTSEGDFKLFISAHIARHYRIDHPSRSLLPSDVVASIAAKTTELFQLVKLI